MKPSRPRVNRRDLFRRNPAAQRPAADASLASSDLLRASRPAMGSYFEVRLGATVPGALDLANRALDLIDALESQLSVYRDDSEVSRLNATAYPGPVRVEPGLFGLLETASAISRASGGAYDVTTGALSAAWGFFRGPKRVPDAETLAQARASTGWELLRLDPERSTMAFERPGVVVNLGSIGKGHAIDRAAGLIGAHWWPTSALIHGGRSSLFALGSPPGTLGGRWEVAVRDPFRPDAPVGIVRLRNRGMGTSGTDFQRFEADGRVFGHILDPRTGAPASGPASVTVLAPTAAEADALSTAFYLLGIKGASAFVQRHPEVGAIFVEGEPGGGTPRVTTVGLSDADYVPAGD